LFRVRCRNIDRRDRRVRLRRSCSMILGSAVRTRRGVYGRKGSWCGERLGDRLHWLSVFGVLYSSVHLEFGRHGMSLNSRDKVDILAEALADLVQDNAQAASERIKANYPFEARPSVKRSWTPSRALAIFRRDGFVDRYSGRRLVYPGTLKVLSLLIPTVFPEHPSWKMSETHFAYWELFPTMDHILPVARGGSDTEENLVTTSFLRNQAKSSWTLEELGWVIHPAGDIEKWDGLLGATCSLVASRPELLANKYLRTWHDAALNSACRTSR
jgi:5-methylcytosine-specific restriction endonuclease McrA